MRLDKDSQQLSSWIGSGCSIILLLVLLTYTFQKLDVLINKKDVDLLTVAAVNALNDDAIFDATNGFGVAVALTSYSATEPVFHDPTIGEVIFNHYKWGDNPDGTV